MTAAELQLAETVIAQGLAFWSAMVTKKATGQLTRADLDAAAAKLDVDLAVLEAEIAARRAT